MDVFLLSCFLHVSTSPEGFWMNNLTSSVSAQTSLHFNDHCIMQHSKFANFVTSVSIPSL